MWDSKTRDLVAFVAGFKFGSRAQQATPLQLQSRSRRLEPESKERGSHFKFEISNLKDGNGIEAGPNGWVEMQILRASG